MGQFKRARQPEQKEQRRAAVLRVAAQMLDQYGIDGVSLNGIAREVGFAKSNLYRYFESREEIFLQLLLEDWRDWVGAIERGLVQLAGSNDAVAVSGVVSRTIVERPRLCQLISVLSSVLEQNLSEATVYAFKSDVMGLAIRIGNAVHAALPTMPFPNVIQLLRSTYALIGGLWPMANPGAVAEKVMQRPEFAPYHTSFAEDLERSVVALIRGMLSS